MGFPNDLFERPPDPTKPAHPPRRSDEPQSVSAPPGVEPTAIELKYLEELRGRLTPIQAPVVAQDQKGWRLGPLEVPSHDGSVLLVGEPGSGRTSLLRSIEWATAGETQTGRAMAPLYVDFGTVKSGDFLDLAAEAVAAASTPDSQVSLRDITGNLPVLLLMDNVALAPRELHLELLDSWRRFFDGLPEGSRFIAAFLPWEVGLFLPWVSDGARLDLAPSTRIGRLASPSKALVRSARER